MPLTPIDHHNNSTTRANRTGYSTMDKSCDSTIFELIWSGFSPRFVIIIFFAALFTWFITPNLSAKPFGETAPPGIDRITPTSFRATWGIFPTENQTTCYQIRIDKALFTPSTIMPIQTVSYLNGSRVYQVEVITYHQGHVADISSSAFVLTAPATPSELIILGVGSTSFTIQWTAVETASEYQILIDGVINKTVSTQTAFLSGFTPGRGMNVTVVARNASGLSFPSKPLFVQLLPPPPALTIQPEDIGQTAFTMRWKPVEGAGSYAVTIDASPTISLASATLTYRAEGLTPGATHTARLATVMPTGQTSEATETHVLTIPATPGLPRALGISTSSFMLDWAPVDGASHYKVYADGDFMIANIPAPLNSTLCDKGFNQGRVASMTVSAGNSSGDSPRSPVLAVTMLGTPTRALEQVHIGDILTDRLLTNSIQSDDKPLIMLFSGDRAIQDAFAGNSDLDGTKRFIVLATPAKSLPLPSLADCGGRLRHRLFGTAHGTGICILDGARRVRVIETDISPDRIAFRLFTAIPEWRGGNGVWRLRLDREQRRFDELHQSSEKSSRP
ncbi:MAG: fibronectin type III domain-containing protein [Candidatus Riflebacteria bacterium]|nr:fibronectin type III domain-containing protein [Candidatus Riflebacteria bacterium]